MSLYLLDTNIILRHLRNDDPKQSPIATALFASAAEDKCEVLITPAVIAESAWVLRTIYKAEHVDIAKQLTALILSLGVRCEYEAIVLDALSRYGQSKLDIVDCLLAAQCVADKYELATFDKGIAKKFPDVKIWDRSGGN